MALISEETRKIIIGDSSGVDRERLVAAIDAAEAEVDRLSRIIGGRTYKPTREEINAHFASHPSGWVLVEFEPGTIRCHEALRCGNPDQAERGVSSNGVVRWWFADRRCIPCDAPSGFAGHE